MKLKPILIACLICLAACNRGDKNLDTDNYTKTKESLEDKEKNHPLDFLSVTSTDKRNLMGQTVISGTVHNNASVCSYKDVRVKMLFFKGGTLVANHEQVLDDAIKANNIKRFKSRYATPKGTDSVALSIMSAVVAAEKN